MRQILKSSYGPAACWATSKYTVSVKPYLVILNKINTVFGCFESHIIFLSENVGERSGSVVECLTRNREAARSSLTGVIALYSLSKTHLS